MSWSFRIIRCSVCLTRSKISNPECSLSSRTFLRKSSYKAAILETVGTPLVIKDVKPAKKLNDKDVRIKVHCCGVNMSDVLMCRGEYETSLNLPFVPGFELSGEVMEVGSKVKDIETGHRVIALAKETYSGFAEECTVPDKDVWKIQESMPFDKAAALVDCYATVLIAMRRVNIESKDPVLVTAAPGGLGLAAVDIAANLYKAKVLGACSAEDKTSVVRDKGAFSVVDYSKKAIVNAVMDFTSKKGVKVVFDAVGGDLTHDCLQCISHEGSIIIGGFASRKIPHITTSQLLPKSCALIGVSLTHYRLADEKLYRDTVKEVLEMFEDDFLEPHISAKYKLNQVNEALQFLEEGSSAGKVILEIK